MNYMIVDGYNVLHANPDLALVSQHSMESARVKLCDALCEFSAQSSYSVIVVFDAHLVSGGHGSRQEYRNILVVYTSYAQTADEYIEKTTRDLRAADASITVATNDTLQQIMVAGGGGRRISAENLWLEITKVKEDMRQKHINRKPIKRNPFLENVDPITAKKMKEMLGL